MKKFFLFAAVAGMLASCSSESLTGSDPNIEPTQEERVPILLGVSSPSVNVSRGTTRGTGTVGGVGDGTNRWYGQTINVFMFEKGFLNLAKENAVALYDAAPMYTPGSDANIIVPKPDATIGEAMLTDGKIQYYPPTGNFDFFGYHGDDAVTTPYDNSEDPWVVDFVINGTQDLMSTKAVLLEQEDPGTIKQETAMGTSEDYYSAKAARKGVQPILQFDHLLSRLSFVIKAGNKNAAGWVDGTPGAQDFDKAVYLNSIDIFSKTTGQMAVAWTNEPAEKITWDDHGTAEDASDDGAPAWLSLKERPASTYADNSDPTNAASYITGADYVQLPDAATDGNSNDKTDYTPAPLYAQRTDPTNRITKAAYDLLPDAATDGDSNDKTDFELIETNNDNLPLVALIPTAPTTADGTTFDEVPVGESLIVAPQNEVYKMRVNLTQKVPTDWNDIATLTPKEMTYELNIPVPEGGFKPNTSYKVILTVYGFERIEVTTMIIPWEEHATPIEVGQD